MQHLSRVRRMAAVGVCAVGTACAGPAARRPQPSALARLLEVDHVQLYVSPGAPEAAALSSAGLLVGDEVTRHTGQGTAARFVAFENGYLELIWVDDTAMVVPASAAEFAARRQRAAWRSTRAIPFGIGLRRRPGVPDSIALPLPTRPYAPPWVRAGTALERLGDPLDPSAPLPWVVPAYMAVDSAVVAGWRSSHSGFAALLKHPLGVRRLDGVRFTLPMRSQSEAITELARSGIIAVASGAEPVLDLTFDGGRRGQRDLRPDLPLILRY